MKWGLILWILAGLVCLPVRSVSASPAANHCGMHESADAEGCCCGKDTECPCPVAAVAPGAGTAVLSGLATVPRPGTTPIGLSRPPAAAAPARSDQPSVPPPRG